MVAEPDDLPIDHSLRRRARAPNHARMTMTANWAGLRGTPTSLSSQDTTLAATIEHKGAAAILWIQRESGGAGSSHASGTPSP